MWRTGLMALGVALLAPALVAQETGVELRVGSAVLEPGEVVDVQLVCTNIGRPGVPEAVVPDGLDLKLLSSTPSFNSMTQIINGRQSHQESYTYALQLSATKEGRYTLGPVSVEADGRTYEARPVQIVVRSTETASVPRGDRYVFVEVNVDRESLYVTETFVATLTFGIRKFEYGGRVFDLNMLRDVLDTRASQLSVFADGRATRSERRLADSNGRRHRYEVFRVTKQVRAEEVGDFQVGPVFLKLQYPVEIRRGFFGGYEITRRRRETARADAVTVTVKGPPVEGRPDDYTGAIGSFSMTASAKPTRVQQGQPITLTLTIRGHPLDGLAGPNLAHHPALASRFDYTPDELVGDVEAGAKVFRRAIFPKQSGEQTVPAISWSYFDPHEERYVTLSSDPIDITVEPPAAGSTALGAMEASKPEVQHTELTVLTGGISPNFTDPAVVLADHAFSLSPPWIAVLVLSPLAWMLVTLTSRHRAHLRADVNLARRRRARREAHARIRQALRSAQPQASLHALAKALSGYVADRYGLSTGAVTPAEIRVSLSANGFDPGTAREIVEFLDACEAAHYAPGIQRDLRPDQAARRIRGWIRRLEKGRA